MTSLSAAGISLSFDTELGMIEAFNVVDGGYEISPLHRAPWVGTGTDFPEDITPHVVKLGGDFFCAPFGSQEDGSALHGWPPNSAWTIEDQGQGHIHAKMDRKVFGAELYKEITLRPGHPFVYQRHIFHGGGGQVPVSNHANVSLPNGGLIRTSPKLCWVTPECALETDPSLGRSGLVYPARSTSATAFPGKDGSVDLTEYPWFPKHEDFVVGLDAPGLSLGWTAITRPNQGDVFLSLRQAKALPMTMLWHSNGGRDYAPWSGRHFGCLGVEEGLAGHVLGAGHEDILGRPGAISLSTGFQVEIHHVIGAIHWPSASGIQDVEVIGDMLRVTGECGQTRDVPFDAAFLGN